MNYFYEEQSYYIYQSIEDMLLTYLDIGYSIIIFQNKNLNKIHYEYLSESLIDYFNNNSNEKIEIIDINNEYFKIKLEKRNLILKIDIEYDNLINEYLFRIQKEV